MKRLHSNSNKMTRPKYCFACAWNELSQTQQANQIRFLSNNVRNSHRYHHSKTFSLLITLSTFMVLLLLYRITDDQCQNRRLWLTFILVHAASSDTTTSIEFQSQQDFNRVVWFLPNWEMRFLSPILLSVWIVFVSILYKNAYPETHQKKYQWNSEELQYIDHIRKTLLGEYDKHADTGGDNVIPNETKERKTKFMLRNQIMKKKNEASTRCIHIFSILLW